jgi:ATP-dependent DNA helicase MPH1
MRIGTQGIDLGSQDTSGDDEDEQPDSELDEFVVRNDQPIEMASSSQRLPDDTQPSRRNQTDSTHGQGNIHKEALFSEDEENVDPGLAEMDIDEEKSSDVEEVAAPQQSVAPVNKVRRRKVVDDSDTDE